MAAQFKSNVRRREEKGFGSVSMKRLIFCGVGAVLVFMVLRFTPLAPISLPLLVGVFALLLLLTAPCGGLPLWQRLLLGLRAGVILAAAHHPTGIAALLAKALNFDPSVVHLHHRRLFLTVAEEDEADFSDWSLYADLSEAEQTAGLFFIKDSEVAREQSL